MLHPFVWMVGNGGFVATQLVISKSSNLPNDKGAISHARLTDAIEAAQPDFIAAWYDLARNASEPNAFSESWYLLPALAQFDPLRLTSLFVLWEGEAGQSRMLGLMPVSAEQRYGRWPISNIQNWLHPNAFLGSPLVQQGHEVAFWRALLVHLDSKPAGGLFLHLNGLAIEGALQKALDKVAQQQNRRIALVHRTERALLEGNSTPQAYYEAAVRAKKRKELRRQKSRLAEIGTLDFMRSNGSSGLEAWADEFLALEKRGWKGANGSALDCADETRRLFHKALFGAAEQGRLELLDLRLNGAPLAMLVNFICPPASFSYKTAFDEDYARFSPGVLLQYENLSLLERDDITYCDSCAAQGHPMIDSLWTGRRAIGRYSVAIGGSGRRALFAGLLRAELKRGQKYITVPRAIEDQGDDQ
jgi:CelD/BcsL family acetyltransferase involved in cellulose biosynthesis